MAQVSALAAAVGLGGNVGPLARNHDGLDHAALALMLLDGAAVAHGAEPAAPCVFAPQPGQGKPGEGDEECAEQKEGVKGGH